MWNTLLNNRSLNFNCDLISIGICLSAAVGSSSAVHTFVHMGVLFATVDVV